MQVKVLRPPAYGRNIAMPLTPKPSKRTSAALVLGDRDQILVAALEHPDLGIRRLSRLLKDMGMEFSESAIRTVLKKEGLHTRGLRLRQLAGRHLTEGLVLSDIQRLALENSNRESLEDYNTSTFDNRPVLGPTQVEAPEPAVLEKPLKREPNPILVLSEAELRGSEPAQRRRDPRIMRQPGRWRWLFRAVNAGLICLIIYLGWEMASQFLYTERQSNDNGLPQTAHPLTPSEPGPVLRAEASELNDYRMVWERNLFGTSRAAGAVAPWDSVVVEKIALAEKDLGLRLIGTALADDSLLNYAVIDVAAISKQGIFREGERVGRSVIRRILRNSAIIQTDTGQQRKLIVDEEISYTTLSAAAPIPNMNEASASAAASPEVLETAVMFKALREEVEPLADTRRLVEETRMSQHVKDGEAAGVLVGAVHPRNPLARIGLRTGDVIKAVSEEETNRLDEAEALSQTLANGGEFTILVERHSRLQRLKVNIE